MNIISQIKKAQFYQTMNLTGKTVVSLQRMILLITLKSKIRLFCFKKTLKNFLIKLEQMIKGSQLQKIEPILINL